jgi:hypothetical protein
MSSCSFGIAVSKISQKLDRKVRGEDDSGGRGWEEKRPMTVHSQLPLL